MRIISRMKRITALIVIVILDVLLIQNNVFGKEINDSDEDIIEEMVRSSGVVWSEPEYDGWKLTWGVGNFYDILEQISRDGDVVKYKYNDAGKRVSKNVNGKLTSYVYDDAGRLISELCDDYVLNYVYCFNEKKGEMQISGFKYNDVEYKYVIDENGIISGIMCRDILIAEYVYEYGVCVSVLGIDEYGKWIDKSSENDFIGCINPYRYKRQYLDSETGWYWVGRYFDQRANRYLDGVSEENAAELIKEYGDTDEIFLKIYTVGNDISNISKLVQDESMISSQSSDIRTWNECTYRRMIDISFTDMVSYVASVIYSESNVYYEDMLGVAWLIKKRMDCNESTFKNLSSAYAVVTHDNDFTAPNDSIEKNSLWEIAVIFARKLCNGDEPSNSYPEYYCGQLFFNSVSTFREKASFTEGYSFDGNFYTPMSDVAIIGYKQLKSDEDKDDKALNKFQGKKNIFFNIRDY